MRQKYVSKSIIPEEPYLLQITYDISALHKTRRTLRKGLRGQTKGSTIRLLKGRFTGQGTGVDITNKNDRLSAVIKTIDTAWYQFQKQYELFGFTEEIISRSFIKVDYKITYYGFQRTFAKITRQGKTYNVKRNSKGRFISFHKYERIPKNTINEDIATNFKEKLDRSTISTREYN